MQEQMQQDSQPTQRVFSAEEAGEILKLATHLQENQFTLSQLVSIAGEAGVSQEALMRAIEQIEAQKAQQAQPPAAKPSTRRWFACRWPSLIGALSVGLVSLVLVRLVLMLPVLRAILGLETYSRELFASSDKVKVYVSRYYGFTGPSDERVSVVVDKTVRFGRQFGRVELVSIAPSSKWIAIYDGAQGELWVTRPDGRGLARIARKGTIHYRGITDLLVFAGGVPSIDWREVEGVTVLVLHTWRGPVQIPLDGSVYFEWQGGIESGSRVVSCESVSSSSRRSRFFCMSAQPVFA
ncbi:MAG: hypothetical protein C4336_03610 [Armatimonadota bacterium]